VRVWFIAQTWQSSLAFVSMPVALNTSSQLGSVRRISCMELILAYRANDCRSKKYATHVYVESIIWLSQSILCLRTGPYRLLMRVLHIVRSSASSLNFPYPILSLRSPSSCLYLLPRFPVTTILHSSFPSNTCFKTQFLHKIQLAFLLCIVCIIYLPSLTLCNTSSYTSWYTHYQGYR
jgi:hypothetical protein